MKKFIQPKPVFAKHGAKAVLLLHAYSGSPNDVRMLCRFLESRDYTVYTPMFSGHGTANPEDILMETTDQWKKDILEAISFLKKEGYESIVVLGLSMGGILAMDLLTKGEPGIVGGGAFCSPLFKTENHVPENFFSYAQKVITYSDLEQKQQEAILENVPQLVKSQLDAIEKIGENVSLQLDKITVPVFLAQGGRDEMIDPKTVFKTAQGLSRTRFTLQWYPKSGHVVTVDQERKRLEQDVADFLDSLSWNEEN